MLKKQMQRGFTIVELLIVIVVIAILAALVLNTFAGVQQRARDTQRQTDIRTISSQLEVFYADRIHYPTYAELTDVTADGWRDNNMPGIDPNAFFAPGTDTDQAVTNFFLSTDAPTISQYGYVPGDCNASDEDCQSFALFWREEGGDGEVQRVDSLN
jgi:prepilin-type N-terminal cleavage/methylation domain-containing protein